MVGTCTALPALGTDSVSNSMEMKEIKGRGGKVKKKKTDIWEVKRGRHRKHDGGKQKGGWEYDRKAKYRRLRGITMVRTAPHRKGKNLP